MGSVDSGVEVGNTKLYPRDWRASRSPDNRVLSIKADVSLGNYSSFS